MNKETYFMLGERVEFSELYKKAFKETKQSSHSRIGRISGHSRSPTCILVTWDNSPNKKFRYAKKYIQKT